MHHEPRGKHDQPKTARSGTSAAFLFRAVQLHLQFPEQGNPGSLLLDSKSQFLSRRTTLLPELGQLKKNRRE